ncbi:hypothetical protein HDV06_001498 [Boothiomyces sp. JEL0866]|nr:hypothetical protein HDV06_001498 [Boothiomyces sp. JEL0866]
MDPLAVYEPTVDGYAEIRKNIKLYYQLWKPEGEPIGYVIMITGVCATLLHFQVFADHLRNRGYEVLLFDHVGTGLTKTDDKLLRGLKYSTCSYATDCLDLINIVWKNKKVNVFGISFGGMVGQKLALLLQKQNRLQSLYLSNSTLCLGKWAAFIPDFCFKLFVKYSKVTVSKAIKQTFHKEFLNQTHPRANRTFRDLIKKKWDKEFNQWFNYENELGEYVKFRAAAKHSVSMSEIKLLQLATVSVWIANRDPVVATRQQKLMASALNANSFKTAVYLFLVLLISCSISITNINSNNRLNMSYITIKTFSFILDTAAQQIHISVYIADFITYIKVLKEYQKNYVQINIYSLFENYGVASPSSLFDPCPGREKETGLLSELLSFAASKGIAITMAANRERNLITCIVEQFQILWNF